MPLLTSDDLSRHSRFAWACLTALLGVVAWLWLEQKHRAAQGTLAALLGCLGLILPPRERMATLPWRIRALPRRLDAAPVLATLLSSPGYGVNWFYGANPYDEIVHLLSGMLAGAVLGALVAADGRPRAAAGLVLIGAGAGLALGVGWEIVEWALSLIGDALDTASDIALTTSGVVIGTLWWGRRRVDSTAPA
ncbi:hypothetical protein [Falsiroseomonas sp. HW251]|uniref:hypothetical protein n=1 Tax=Falsiroseomonas sp. HW251 TaxID=3390998 RepID=UPI003D3151B7